MRPRRYRGIPVGAAALSRAEQTHTHPLPAAPSSVRPLVRNGRKPPPGHESPAQPSAAGSAPRVPLEHGQHAKEESHLHAWRNPTYRSRSGTASALRTASSSRRRCAHTHARAPTHVAHIAHRNTRMRARAHAYAYAHAHTHLYTCTDMAYICIDISMCVRVCINIGSLYVHRFVGMGHRCAAIGRKAQADCLYACAWRWIWMWLHRP